MEADCLGDDKPHGMQQLDEAIPTTTRETSQKYLPYDGNLADRSLDGVLDLECIGSSNGSCGGDQQQPPSLLEQSGGRDSGISTTESLKYQDFLTKCCQVEDKIKERVTASQIELQEAKKKLEELRLLRFEEKNVLRQEIEQLNEKVDEEENRTSKMGDQLKQLQTEKILTTQRLSDLAKEQEIGSQINMIQEQEIVRLEMRLKQEEIERFNVSQQLDQQRRTVIEKDKFRLKQQGELYILNERVLQLEESNLYYKNESGINYRKARECDQAMRDLQTEIKGLQRTNEDSMVDLTNVNLEIKVLEAEKARFEDEAQEGHAEIEKLKKKLEIQITRCETLEKEFKNHESLLQQDLENSSLNETKLVERCDELETLYHDNRRQKDEQHFELTQVIERANALEQRITEVEDEKTDLEFDFCELRNALCRHIKSHENAEQTTSPSKNEKPLQQTITVNDLEVFFAENNSKMYRYQHDIDDLSSQMVKERTIVGELNETINDLKLELNRAQGNMDNIATLKDTLESQQQRTTETMKIQEKDIERKSEENERLREVVSDYEQRLSLLETEVSAMNDDTKQFAANHKEERKKLKAKLHEVEAQKQLVESAKRKLEIRFDSEREKAEEELRQKCKDNDELKNELEKLIEDNKNLAKRLLHLESYSDRLSEMLEHQQTENQKLKDKVQKEFRHFKNESGEKEQEISSLKDKLGDLNRSLTERLDKQDKLGSKLKSVKDNCKDVEKKNRELETYNEELKKRLDLVNEAHMKAERQVISTAEGSKDQKKAIEELLNKVGVLEQDKATLKEGLYSSEKRIQLKESLIAELSKKTGQAAENFNSLRHTFEKAEYEGKQYEKKFVELRQNQMGLEKMLNESEAERQHQKEQIANLQRLLARCEDEKDISLADCARYQRQLDTERATKQMLHNHNEQNKQKKDLEELQEQVMSLHSELGQEKKRRERLEEMYNKRDDQVSQLRSTFDQSLNTLSKDTKNIKSILGKSLKKIDRDIIVANGNNGINNNDCVTSSEQTSPESDYTPSTRLSSSRYLNLPLSYRSKSVESPVEELRHKLSIPLKVSTPSSAKSYGRTVKASPVLVASNIPPRYSRGLYANEEAPVRDTGYGSSRVKGNKRYSK